MKTIATVLIILFWFSTNSFSFGRTGCSGDCCRGDKTAKAQTEHIMLDQLQCESENTLSDHALATQDPLHTTVTRKLQEMALADGIQEETEQLLAELPLAFSYHEQSEGRDDATLEKLQKETEVF